MDKNPIKKAVNTVNKITIKIDLEQKKAVFLKKTNQMPIFDQKKEN
jgi:hypothetical protein